MLDETAIQNAVTFDPAMWPRPWVGNDAPRDLAQDCAVPIGREGEDRRPHGLSLSLEEVALQLHKT